MKAFLWMLDKIFAILADVGILCVIVLLVAGDGLTALTICSAIGSPLAALGAFIGKKIWEYDIAPFTLFFRNRIQLGQSEISAIILWAGRFFLLPFVGAGIYYVLA